MSDRIRTESGTEVYIWRDPVGFLGDRIRITHPNAPADLHGTEVGLTGEVEQKPFLQLPGQAFGLSPEVLRAIAHLLEGGN